jgi:hypothetical protein
MTTQILNRTSSHASPQQWGGSTLSAVDFGTAGDGLSDDREALQRALGDGGRTVSVPPGTYRLGGALRLSSGSRLLAHPEAHFILADEAGVSSDVFLLTNADEKNGNADIRVEGGIWDGNNRRNLRGTDTPGAYTGVGMNFIHVDGLEVYGLRMRDAETYFIRLSQVKNFRFTDVRFSTSNPRPNQDGIHIAGHCHKGLLAGIHGEGPGATHDDLVALVADDALERAQNLGLSCGPLSNIVVQDLSAEDCHCFVRLASVRHSIRGVRVEKVRGGCEGCAVNMDALRYCAVPLFRRGDGQFNDGAGDIRDVRLHDFEVFRSGTRLDNPLLLLETRADQLEITHFRRLMERDHAPHIATLRVADVPGHTVEIAGLSPDALEAIATEGGLKTSHTAGVLQASLENPEDKLISRCLAFERLHMRKGR